MSESEELYASVNYIKHKVEAIEKIELLNLRSNEKLLEMYIKALESDEWLLKVYREIDGIKSQKEIASKLATTEMTISNKIRELRNIGLIEKMDVLGKQHIYKYSIAEEAFKLNNRLKGVLNER